MKNPDKNSEPLDAVLRRAMRQQPGPATPECADADSLAAYSEKSLAAPERERLETHFADCMRCQVLLADIARAEQHARDAGAVSAIPWYRRWRVAIPALAAVAALVVVVRIISPGNDELQRVAMLKPGVPAMELAAKAPAPGSPVNLPASEPPAPPMQLAEKAPAPAPQAEVPAAKPAAPPMQLAARAHAPAPRAVEQSAPLAAPVLAPTVPSSNEIAMNEAKPESAPRAREMGGSFLHRMTTSAEAPEAASAPPAASAPQTASAPQAMAMPAAAAPIAGYGAAGSYGAAVAGAAGGSSVSAAPAPETLAMISPPDRSVRWTIGKNGMLRRNDANGETQVQHSGVTTDLIAGAAPSATVCWIVGRSGTIIRTTDGEHWALIPAPTSDNLVAVTAGSATDAVVTAADGKSFATSDGGASWHARQ